MDGNEVLVGVYQGVRRHSRDGARDFWGTITYRMSSYAATVSSRHARMGLWDAEGIVCLCMT